MRPCSAALAAYLAANDTVIVTDLYSLASGTAGLLKPFLSPVAVGDSFRLLPGCDHTVVTCNTVFNNLVHYGGMPYIPPPETAV